MNTPESREPWEELAALANEKESEGVEQFLSELPNNEVPLVLSRLSDSDQTEVLTSVDPSVAARLFESIPEFQAVGLIEQLKPADAAAIIDELPSNEQADLLVELDQKCAAAILGEMREDEARDARQLSQYPDDVAGGLMITELLRFPATASVEDVVKDLRANADTYRDYEVQYAYVNDASGRLVGVLRLRDLLLGARRLTIDKLMIPDPVSVPVDSNLETLVDLFESRHYLGLPVVDTDRRLLGVVLREAVDEAVADRQESDLLKLQGIVGGEEVRSMPLARRSRRRLSWLSVNIVLNVMAASVIALFQDTLSSVIALAVFLPIISDMSGCSGSQAVAVSLRELSLGLVRPHELYRVWTKELAVGVINGTVLGMLLASVAWLWKGNVYLGLVVGVALALNTLVAVSIGGLVPLVLRRLHVDPAIAAGPILTTVTDMCGFFLVLGIATVMLQRLL